MDAGEVVESGTHQELLSRGSTTRVSSLRSCRRRAARCRVRLVLVTRSSRARAARTIRWRAERTSPSSSRRTRAAPAVERTETERTGYVGVFTAKDLAEVVAPFTSNVARLEVKLGDRVEAKQALALLDDRPLREELEIAKAALHTARTEVAQADVARGAAKAGLEREQKALKEGVVSQAEVTAARFDLQKAEMSVARASAAVGEQKAKIEQLKAS